MSNLNRRIFRGLLPYSMSRQTRLIVTIILALTVGIVWYCEKTGEAMSPPKAVAASKLETRNPERETRNP